MCLLNVDIKQTLLVFIRKTNKKILTLDLDLNFYYCYKSTFLFENKIKIKNNNIKEKLLDITLNLLKFINIINSLIHRFVEVFFVIFKLNLNQ